MSHVDSGPLAGYNSLQDKHLIGYFNNTRMRRHLRRSGLITRNGEIVTENSFRLNMARKEHRKHVRDLMAQAIVHKALDMERHRQAEIKRKLEEISKVELVQRVRSTRGRKGDEDITPYLSPRAPPGRPKSAKQERPRSVVSGHRPSTAPSKHSGSSKKKSAIYVDKEGFPVHRDQAWGGSDDGSDEIDSHNLRELDSYSMNNITLNLTPEEKLSNSPYKVDLTQTEPRPPPRAAQGSKKSPRGTTRTVITRDGRRIRPKSNKGSLSLHRKEPAYPHPTQQQTLCDVTIRYRGNNLKLQYERQDKRDEIIINQQHCGGENLVVFHGLVEAGTDLVFTSRRHRGYPFSLTFFVNSLQVLRLSACCEYKYGPGVMLGGRKGHFKFGRVDGGSPCYRCMVEAELARRERQRYKDTQTEEPKPEPEPEPVLETQGTQSDPPPPETRDQAEQAEAGEGEDQTYDDDDFEDEDHQEADAEDTKSEGKSSDHFFSGAESDSEKKQQKDGDYGADSDFEADSNHEKQDEEDGDKKGEQEDAGDDIPEEEEARDDDVQNEQEEKPIKDETQAAKEDVKEAPGEKEGHNSVPEETPQVENEKDEKEEQQSSKHDDSDSDSDSEGDNKVLSSSSSSSSSEDEDQKTPRNASQAAASSSGSFSDEEEVKKEKQDQDDKEQKLNEEPVDKDDALFVAEKSGEPQSEDGERELDDNFKPQSKEDEAKEDEERRSPSPPATEEKEIPSTVSDEQLEETKEDEVEFDEKKDDDKTDEDEKDDKSFLEKMADKVKAVFTSSDSSDSESNSDKEKKKRRKKKRTKSKSKSDSDDEKKSKTSDSDSDKGKEKSFFQKLKDKFTSSDSDSDDEKKKEKNKEKSDSDAAAKHSEDDDGHSQDDKSIQNKETDSPKPSRKKEREEKQEGSRQRSPSPQVEEEREKSSFEQEDDREKDGSKNAPKPEEIGTPPPKEEEEEKSKMDTFGDMLGGSDSDSNSEKQDDEAKEKEDTIKAESDAETGAVAAEQETQEEKEEEDKSQLDKVEGGDMLGGSDPDSSSEKEDDKAKEVAAPPPTEEKEEEKSEDRVGDMLGPSDSDSDPDRDQSEEKEDLQKADKDEESGSTATPQKEVKPSESEDESQKQSEKEDEDDKTEDKEDTASHHSDQEALKDDDSQNKDEAAVADRDQEEITEDEKQEENKSEDTKDEETGASQQQEDENPPTVKDEEDTKSEALGDGDSVKNERQDDGSIASRSSVSDSGSIAGGLDKEYKVLNLNERSLDGNKAAKLAKALRQHKYRNLEYLLLRDNTLTDSGVATIIRSLIEKQTTATSADSALKLTHFDLGNTELGDEAAAELSKLLKLDTPLRNLNISENLVSAAAWEAIIEGLRANRTLVTFSAEYAHLSDTSCVMLADALADHERMEELNIEGNGLGERAGNALAQLVKDNSVIITINLEKDNSISPNIVTEIKEILETGSYVP